MKNLQKCLVIVVLCALALSAYPKSPPSVSASGSCSAFPGFDQAKAESADLAFSVMGDARSQHGWLNPDSDPDYSLYTNVAVFKPLAQDLVRCAPAIPGFFSIFQGDMTRWSGLPTFNSFKALVKPLFWEHSPQVPFYLVHGNHETYWYEVDETYPKDPEDTRKAQEAYHTAFTRQPKPHQQPPQYAWIPADADRAKGFDGHVYSYVRGDSLFVALDAFFTNSTYEDGYYDDPQLIWLNQALAASSSEHKFVFSHMPTFNASEGDGKFYSKYAPDTAPRSLWILWALLSYYEVDVFFSSHSHYYHRWDVSGSQFEACKPYDDDWAPMPPQIEAVLRDQTPCKTMIPQIITGTCGASFTDLPSHPTVPPVVQSKNYNHALVTVDDDGVTVQTYIFEVEDGRAEHCLIDELVKTPGKPWKTITPSRSCPITAAAQEQADGKQKAY